jgi:hypothetical protein
MVQKVRREETPMRHFVLFSTLRVKTKLGDL